MKLVFYSNYLNHHQVLIADELYVLLGEKYRFVATMPSNEKELKGGADYSNRPYCILAGEGIDAREEAMRLARESEVCVFGACSQEYAVIRAKGNHSGLSFEMGERWLKRGWLNIFSPRLIRWWINYRRYFHRKSFYKLCSSAFCAIDDWRLFAYRGRHYKWGYFTSVETELQESDWEIPTQKIVPQYKLMWCGRFLNWKHPELPIRMAANLKRKGYQFVLDMYGVGEELTATRDLVREMEVDDVVQFHGAKPNSEILKAMRNHDIFLFTSDRNEGWGAVANEAMANGCVLVASDAIGSAPYLVKNGINGYTFASENVDSLMMYVEELLCNPKLQQSMKIEARRTMVEVWSPRKAAVALLQLIDDLENGRECSILQGPCSIA